MICGRIDTMLLISSQGETQLRVKTQDLAMWHVSDMVADELIYTDEWSYSDVRMNPRRLRIHRLKYSDHLTFSSRKVLR